MVYGGYCDGIKDSYIEDRVRALALYIIENGATVRDAATIFKVSKSTVHAEKKTGNDSG